MPRALWKGAISFGLVNIPVELYPAEERKGFSFSMLDKRDLSPVGYKRYNKTTGKEVEWGDVIKGYEYEKDQFVVLSPEDFKRANVKASQTVDIKAFVPAEEIAPHWYETPYYLAPGKRGEKVYALLRETLKTMGKVAVAQVVIRTTQHLAAVVPEGKVLMMITLRYGDELRDTKGLELPAEGLKGAGVTPKEVELAKRLIEELSEHWKPDEFRDTYHEDLMHRIQEKIDAGETNVITQPEKGEKAEPKTAQVIDLSELLRQSLGQGRKGAKGGKAAKAADADEAADEGDSRTAANDDSSDEALPRQAAKRAKAAAKTSAASSGAKPAAKSAAKTTARKSTASSHKTEAKRKRA